MVRAWQGDVFDLVSREAAGKRTSARIASLGVNGAGLVVMLAVFAHTGGLTGAEVVVAGGTTAVGQRVLEALLGDQAVRTMAARAREDLLRRTRELLDAEAGRYHDRVRRAGPSAGRARAPRRRDPECRASALSGALERRLEALGGAAAIAGDRLDADAVTEAQDVVRRAGERLGHGLEATVVALAGPTGAGKSTLFNALAGRALVTEGVRRPTTSAATAAVWGSAGGGLLDWLDVPMRHSLDGDGPDGLVLLDLPDFDSVETSHRLEVDRLVRLVDLLIWVVDPQKYADAALHDRYLRRLAGHAGAMLVVLNQADRLGAGVTRAAADLRRLIAEDGLEGVPVVAASARTGEGVDALREVLAERVAGRKAALERLAADVTVAATRLSHAAGAGAGGGCRPR